MLSCLALLVTAFSTYLMLEIYAPVETIYPLIGLLIAVVTLVIEHDHKRLSLESILNSTVIVGGIAAINIGVSAILIRLACRLHDSYRLGSMLSMVLRLAGFGTIINRRGEVISDLFYDYTPVRLGWDHLYIAFLAFIAFDFLIILWSNHSVNWMTVGKLIGSVCIAVLLESVFAVTWVADGKPYRSRFMPSGLLLPSLFVFAGLYFTRLRITLPRCQGMPTKKQFIGILCAGLFLSAGMQVPFVLPKDLRGHAILIDDYHSEWEWSTIPFDTTVYGRKAVYNYWCLRDYLSHYYSIDVNDDSPLTLDLLKKYDLVILKTPTKDFGLDEVACIREYASGGGRLLLLGDHTDLFGMNTRLNQLCAGSGLRFVPDCTYEMFTGELRLWKRPVLQPIHPALAGVDRLRFATSCSIQASWWTEDVMWGGYLGSDYLDYSNPGFFRICSLIPGIIVVLLTCVRYLILTRERFACFLTAPFSRISTYTCLERRNFS